MLVAMTKEETEKLIRIKNRILDMLVISEDDAYNFAHTCLTCGLDFVKRKRTEADILNEFEKLGYKIAFVNQENRLLLYKNNGDTIFIYKNTKEYEKCDIIQSINFTMQEHKLLNELFICWGWL